jgi:hypothetical protein
MSLEKKFRLPKEIPLEEYPDPQTFLDEARSLIEGAQKQGIIIRVMGPIALHFYFPEYVDLYHRMERLGDRVFTDIDYASYGKCRGKIVPFFQSHGYEIEKRAAMISGNTRHIYFGGAVPMIDVFFDKLAYNHPIEFKNRLEVHPQCISLSDLLLQKMQIVQINDKDLKDAMLLFLAAPVGEDDHGAINCKYVAKLMSDDWGFYYTATTNLAKVKSATAGLAVLDDKQREIIYKKADQVLQSIEEVPKSGNWKRRAKIGTQKPWYNLVEDWD